MSQRLDTLLGFLQTNREGSEAYTEEVLRAAEAELASIQADMERLEEDIPGYLRSIECEGGEDNQVDEAVSADGGDENDGANKNGEKGEDHEDKKENEGSDSLLAD